jgi:hypothetical protein
MAKALYPRPGEKGRTWSRLAARRAVGLAGRYLGRRALRERFGIKSAAAIMRFGDVDADLYDFPRPGA